MMTANKSIKKKMSINKAKITNKISSVDVTPQAVASVGKNQLKGFVDFIRTQGVVGLAVGLVLGGSVSVLVKSLVDNIVMPPLGFILGSAEGLKGLTWVIGKTASGKPAVVDYGVFLNDFINFVVIAFVVYFIVKLLKFDQFDKKKV